MTEPNRPNTSGMVPVTVTVTNGMFEPLKVSQGVTVFGTGFWVTTTPPGGGGIDAMPPIWERTRPVLPSIELESVILPHKERERSEEHTSELQSPCNLVCRLLLEKKKNIKI